MHGELRAIRTWVFTDVYKSYYYNWYLTIYLVMSNVLMNTPWIFLELSRNIKFNVTDEVNTRYYHLADEDEIKEYITDVSKVFNNIQIKYTLSLGNWYIYFNYM